MNENSIHQAALTRALDVAQKIIGAIGIEEWDSVSTSAREISVHLHVRPVGVAQAAEALGLALSLVIRGDDRPTVQAVGEVDGLRVEVWALGSATDQELYRSAVAPSGLPSAWSAAAVSA